MKIIKQITLSFVLNLYALVLCLGSILWIQGTALLLKISSSIVYFILPKNKQNPIFFIIPFNSYTQWKSYLQIIRSFIKASSFSETYQLFYYKFRKSNQKTHDDLPYFKFPKIKSEQEFYSSEQFMGIESLLHNKDLIFQEYSHAVQLQKPYINEAGNAHTDWNTIMLYANDQLNEKSKVHFPKTLEIIHQIPNIDYSMIMFSVLQADAHIPPHTGPFNAFLRVHLPIILPNDFKNCNLFVADKKTNWEQNELMIFDDSFIHSVKNKTNEIRIVLMLSIWKPDVQQELKNLIRKFIHLFYSSPSMQKWANDNQ